jgi:hypothetical protein
MKNTFISFLVNSLQQQVEVDFVHGALCRLVLEKTRRRTGTAAWASIQTSPHALPLAAARALPESSRSLRRRLRSGGTFDFLCGQRQHDHHSDCQFWPMTGDSVRIFSCFWSPAATPRSLPI